MLQKTKKPNKQIPAVKNQKKSLQIDKKSTKSKQTKLVKWWKDKKIQKNKKLSNNNIQSKSKKLKTVKKVKSSKIESNSQNNKTKYVTKKVSNTTPPKSTKAKKVSPQKIQIPIIKIWELKGPNIKEQIDKAPHKSKANKTIKKKKIRIPKASYQKVFEAYLEEREAKYRLIKAKVKRLEAQLDMEYDIKSKRQDILQNIEKLRKFSNNMLREKVQYLKTIRQIDYAHEEIRWDIKKNVDKIMGKVKKNFWKLIEKI